MAIPMGLQKQVNGAISGLQQNRNPLQRSQLAGELMNYLKGVIDDLAEGQRESIAEAVNWPGESMATVATKLNLSKSAVAKLATPDIRDVIAKDLRARLAKGYNPPPPRT